MKALCITGSDSQTLKTIATPFYEAGMQAAQSIHREAEIDFETWHKRAYSSLAKAKPIGRVWENLAIDLLLANIENDCWGWVDEKSVHALNFWADLEPEIHFLLVTNRPDQELIKRLQKGDSIEQGSTLIEEWFARHQAMLDFYLANPERCIIVDEQDASRHLTDQLMIANKHWQLTLQTEQIEMQPIDDSAIENTQSGNNVVQLLAKEVLKQTSLDLEGLHQEIQAAKYTFESNQDVQDQVDQFMSWLKSDLSKEELHEILVDYQNLTKQANEAKNLLIQQEQQASEIKLIEQSSATTVKENELITLQLQQTQEELEAVYSDKQKIELDLSEKLNEVNALKNNLVNVLAQVTELNNFKQENELITLQLQQTQEELETVYSDKQKLETVVVEKNTEINFLKENIVEASNQSPKLVSLQQENELLTLQLHQTQEELEQVFGKATNLESLLEQNNQNSNEYEINAIKHEYEARQAELNDQIQQLLTAKQALENTHKDLQQDHQESINKYQVLEQKIKEMSGFKQENELLQLQLQQTQEELEHYFNENQKNKDSIAELEKSKSLLLTKVSHLEDEITNKGFSVLRKKKPEEKLHYQSAILLNEQVNPDYEHLWIRLQSPSFEHQSASAWNFRVSCSNVSGENFGKQPKLELPEQSEQLLNQWFAESEDAEGKKLELRFALPKSMDKQVWRQINPADQKLIKALVKQLPEIMAELQASTQISRDWGEWFKLSNDMQKVLKAKTK